MALLKYTDTRAVKGVWSMSIGENVHEITLEFSDLEYIVPKEDALQNLNVSSSQWRAMYRWMLARRRRKLHNDVWERWGFLDTPDIGPPCSHQAWQLRRIVLVGDDERGFRQSGYHASDKQRGGAETFWRIAFHTLQLNSIPYLPGEERGSDYDKDVIVEDQVARMRPSVRIALNQRAKAQYMDRVDRWCEAHVGRFLEIAGPGDRSLSTIDERLKADRAIFCVSKHGYCARAAIANGLKALGDEDAAMRFLHFPPMGVRTLGGASRQLEESMRTYCLQNASIPSGYDKKEWLMQQRSGVFLVRLIGRRVDGTTVDHIIVVDAERRLVYDCAEEVALLMDSRVVHACVGSDARLEDISQIKKLARQPESKGKKRKTHKMSREKRKQKRHEKRAGKQGMEY